MMEKYWEALFLAEPYSLGVWDSLTGKESVPVVQVGVVVARKDDVLQDDVAVTNLCVDCDAGDESDVNILN